MKAFFKQGWGKFQFGKNFLERESPTLTFITRFKNVVAMTTGPKLFSKLFAPKKCTIKFCC